jgi:ABC-type lipoprotein release transport system permease subunit
MIGQSDLVATVAWRNLWRRPRRTVLSLLSIALVVAILVFMLSFQLSIYASMKQNTLRILDGYAEIQPKGYSADPTLDRAIAAPGKLASEALGIAGVTAAAPRLDAFAILANGARSYGGAVIGVDPGSEPKVSSIAAMIRSGRYLKPADNADAVLGDMLARNLALSPGHTVTLLGQARDGSVAADVLRVVGVFHSGIPELDRSILEMPLSRAQDTFAMAGHANIIALSGPTLADVNDALPALRTLAGRRGAVVLGWRALEPAMRDAIALDMSIGALLYATLVAVVAFIILDTLLMSVLERTREFGTLMAVGMRPRLIGRMVWIELLSLAFLGCLAGLALGCAVTLKLHQVGIVFPGVSELFARFGLPPRLYPALTPASALIGPAAILTAIALGGIVPYLRVARLTAALAMRAA